ncbi:hypothetical protein [Paraburkholderia antibiotica]|uniref:Uncharacterized protein n=1 Tax=Paraburkholderia antibiotica TaxID=2728839 RepID=A0A7X9ZW31_9BURK|nr:hypothetical protein [Paraburkholderia antibiotica]NML30276.1 hypothetical protein [Paraburkholderia antibiotica]
MKRIMRNIATAFAFVAGEILVVLMLCVALVCKLTARIGESGRSRPPR